MSRLAKLNARLKHSHSLLKFFIDLLFWSLAVPAAFWLRLESAWITHFSTILKYSLLSMFVKAFLIYMLGLHHQSWRKLGVRDLYALLQGIASGMLILSGLGFMANPYLNLPRSIPFLEGGLALLALGGARLSLRLLHESLARRKVIGAVEQVLIIGAGEAGTMIAREMLRHPEAGLSPVGFLDDDPGKRHERFMGLRVLGTVEDLPHVVRRARVDKVLIAMPSAPGRIVRQVVELARQSGVQSRIIPGVYEILNKEVMISQIREVDLDDLLRREPVKLNVAEISDYLEGQVVLVTGAGGSIGSEIVRQVARFRPGKLLLLGRGENSLYEIAQELHATWPDLDHRIIVSDIQRREKVEYIFDLHYPEVVFHAAAHKHVPIMEINPDEAILNNVGGTKILAETALQYGAKHFVNLSTDKAVNPTSVMGASKRVTEYLVARAASLANPGQVFVSVRFGNVLGSRGSVVPLFKKQIRGGGPVTVTHPDMTRFFMTIPEATQLVIQAGGLGANGAVCVLNMGEPIKIRDLATDLIRLSGLNPGEDIPIIFTEVRPGEKLSEEILTDEEDVGVSRHKNIFVSAITVPDGEFDHLVEDLLAAAHNQDEPRIRAVLKELIPSYQPSTLADLGTPRFEVERHVLVD